MSTTIKTDKKPFWPRCVYYKIHWNHREYFMMIDSTKMFVSVLKSFYLGNVNFRSKQIIDEFNLILAEKDYIHKPLMISTQIDDDGGLFILVPTNKSIGINTIIPTQFDHKGDMTINIVNRLNSKYEHTEDRKSYYDTTMFDMCSIMDDLSDDEETMNKNN